MLQTLNKPSIKLSAGAKKTFCLAKSSNVPSTLMYRVVHHFTNISNYGDWIIASYCVY